MRKKFINNLNIVKEKVQDEIQILKIKFNESVIRADINTIPKSIEILQRYLFLIKLELEFYECCVQLKENNKKLKAKIKLKSKLLFKLSLSFDIEDELVIITTKRIY